MFVDLLRWYLLVLSPFKNNGGVYIVNYRYNCKYICDENAAYRKWQHSGSKGHFGGYKGNTAGYKGNTAGYKGNTAERHTKKA